MKQCQPPSGSKLQRMMIWIYSTDRVDTVMETEQKTEPSSVLQRQLMYPLILSCEGKGEWLIKY